ncbi:hypothetical protein CEXT_541901 [Caerostris extrusa]|uniref:Secreted protein n=1 Tax=Caerostris extrusa TaxID=172846 RepID=A0AAV4TP99_CAEEX|nr:hypothetical protein CEXT_541901 [Caerostris extrusa]
MNLAKFAVVMLPPIYQCFHILQNCTIKTDAIKNECKIISILDEPVVVDIRSRQRGTSSFPVRNPACTSLSTRLSDRQPTRRECS